MAQLRWYCEICKRKHFDFEPCIKQPPNQEVATSQEPCEHCKTLAKYTTDEFCRACGLALDR